MEHHPKISLPGPVTGVGRRIEAWRRTRAKLGPMPEALWREAAQLAQAHGVSPIASALRLEYYALKRHVAEARRPEAAAQRAFVEVSVCPPALSPDCVVEMERPDGARLRVQLPSQENLVALTEAFWRCRE